MNKKIKKILYKAEYNNEHGTRTMLATDVGVCWISMPHQPLEDGLAYLKRYIDIETVINKSNQHLELGMKELNAFFKGSLRHFNCALDVYGTHFQKMVWDAALAVDYGQTRTYGFIAAYLNNPLASRAVGSALGANPLAPIIPCHRIVGVHKLLTGYAGGLVLKKSLLDREKIIN